jgi:hypothetical protein
MRKFVLSAVATTFIITACAETTAVSNSFDTTLRGSQVVPAVATAATGTATLTVAGANLNYTLNWAGLSGAPTAAHIHVGAAGAAAGTTRVNLCGAGGAAACPTATTGSLTGVIAPANVVASGGYTMDSLLVQMRNFNAAVDVHTAANSAGEIRGQLIP